MENNVEYFKCELCQKEVNVFDKIYHQRKCQNSHRIKINYSFIGFKNIMNNQNNINDFTRNKERNKLELNNIIAQYNKQNNEASNNILKTERKQKNTINIIRKNKSPKKCLNFQNDINKNIYMDIKSNISQIKIRVSNKKQTINNDEIKNMLEQKLNDIIEIEAQLNESELVIQKDKIHNLKIEIENIIKKEEIEEKNKKEEEIKRRIFKNEDILKAFNERIKRIIRERKRREIEEKEIEEEQQAIIRERRKIIEERINILDEEIRRINNIQRRSPLRNDINRRNNNNNENNNIRIHNENRNERNINNNNNIRIHNENRNERNINNNNNIRINIENNNQINIRNEFNLRRRIRNKREENSILSKLIITKIIDVNKLPEDKKTCTICLGDYLNNENTIYLPCLHLFHEDCIKSWVKRNPICPVCIYDLKNIDNF